MKLRFAALGAVLVAVALTLTALLAGGPPLPTTTELSGGDHGDMSLILALGFAMLATVGAGAAIGHLRKR